MIRNDKTILEISNYTGTIECVTVIKDKGFLYLGFLLEGSKCTKSGTNKIGEICWLRNAYVVRT